MSNYVGCLTGSNQGLIEACYCTGHANGKSYVGGLAGWNSGTITASYSIASVSGTDTYIGGLVGYSYSVGVVHSSFWDMELSEQTGSGAGKGLTTLQMKTVSIFQNVGWNAYGWTMTAGSYPSFNANLPVPSPGTIPLLGSGSENDPYQIHSITDFALLSWHSGVLGKHVRLMADLNLSGVNLYPIGDLGPFSGVFDGNGHTLFNISMHQSNSDYVAPFGHVLEGGRITDLHIQNVSIQGRRAVSGLAAKTTGFITNCTVHGQINGQEDTGGFVGLQNHGGTIESCHADVTVEGAKYTGGLVGLNRSAISKSSAVGKVIGTQDTGGLVGYNQGCPISLCFARCDVNGLKNTGGLVGSAIYMESVIVNNYAEGPVRGTSYVGGLFGYFNSARIDKCYSVDSVSGTNGLYSLTSWAAKTTAEMKTRATFAGSGWDFLGESANGENEIWRMCVDGVDYPRLSWEFAKQGDFACADGIDLADLLALTEHWLMTEANDPTVFSYAADANADARINLEDLAILSSNWP